MKKKQFFSGGCHAKKNALPQTEVGFALPLFKFETLTGSSVSPKLGDIAITLDQGPHWMYLHRGEGNTLLHLSTGAIHLTPP